MAAPDRRQPCDRLGARPQAASRGRAHRVRGSVRDARAAGDETLAALARLSPEHRAVIVMRYLLEFTPGEIAERARPSARNGQLQAPTRARRPRGGAVRDELERIEIPGEHEARQRTWRVVETGFAERHPVERRPRMVRPAIAIAVIAAALAAVLSPPGRAVLDEIREAVGVERAQPALFSLPPQAVSSSPRTRASGSSSRTARSGYSATYREASWSPFGRFVVATRENELAALEPDGDVRWTLARPGVRSPRLGAARRPIRASPTSTAQGCVSWPATAPGIASSCADSEASSPGTRADPSLLAVANRGEVRVIDVTTGRTRWRRDAPGLTPIDVAWASSGRRFHVASARGLHVYDANGNRPLELGPGASRLLGAALSPAGGKACSRRAALARLSSGSFRESARMRTQLAGSSRRRGRLEPTAWAPDGRWIAVRLGGRRPVDLRAC